MTRSSRSCKTAANLSESVHSLLNTYALAAGAACVGVLALAQPSEAKIIYTSADVRISRFGIFPYPLDLNNDGITDFIFPTSNFVNSGFFESGMSVAPAFKGNRVWGLPYASALKAGVRVGVEGKFDVTTNLLMGWSSGTFVNRNFRGPWDNRGKGVKNRFLGLKFVIKGKVHFGWARINFTNPANVVLTGYAYETIPGKAIIAGATKGTDDDAQRVPTTHTSPTPEPAMLGVLALGAPGLSIWRRDEPVAATSDRN